MKVLSDERTYRELTGPLVLTQADDAWHPHEDRNYVEWWYFDLINSDGGIVRGQFFISRDVSRPDQVRTGVRASYVKSDGAEILIEERFRFPLFWASTEQCDVQIGRNFIRGDLKDYTVHIESEDKTLDLELTSHLDGFRSHACFGDDRHCMHWVVPQPKCAAKGVFRTGSEILPIDGTGYRDHNWLNFPAMDVLAYWDWGRAYDEEYTIIFADIATTKKYGGAEIKPFVLYDSKGLAFLTGEGNRWTFEKKGARFDGGTARDYADTCLIRVNEGDFSFSLELKLERVFQRLDLLADFNPVLRFLIKTFKAKPTITSFFSRGTGSLELGKTTRQLSVSAVHEFLTNVAR
ncbi:MAG: hypothetical protein IBX68_01375 [Dehalococcoidia bacterium]|nr:hypothetical protein [Dehalococcoidia bacterium]